MAWEFDEAKHGQPSRKEIANNWEFMVNFLLCTKGGTSASKVPNLIKQAKLIGDKIDERLYTKESCKEFHVMLLEHIEDFMGSLISLGKVKRTARPTPGTQDLKSKVLQARVSGYMLQKLQ